MKMKLRALRVNKGLKAIEVADMLGVNVKTVSNWENGKNRIPFDSVKRLADIYGCTIDQIDL